MSLFVKITQTVAAALSTGIVTYPFYALVDRLSDLNPDNLRACNKGCTYMRFWGTPGLPRTAPRYLEDRELDDMSLHQVLSGDDLPNFAAVRNFDLHPTGSNTSG